MQQHFASATAQLEALCAGEMSSRGLLDAQLARPQFEIASPAEPHRWPHIERPDKMRERVSGRGGCDLVGKREMSSCMVGRTGRWARLSTTS